MRTIREMSRFRATIVAVASLLVPLARGLSSPISYTVSVNTSAINGTSGFLDFGFAPGFDSQSAFVTISDFSPAALLVGAPQVNGDVVTLRGGRRLHGVEIDGDRIIDCIPVLVAAACFAEGESVFYNVESLHYKESDRIDDLCAELRKAGCSVVPKRDAIVVRGRPQGISGGVEVDGHSDHRLLMALAIAALRSQRGLTLSGVPHIAKSYPHFFTELQHLGVDVRAI